MHYCVYVVVRFLISQPAVILQNFLCLSADGIAATAKDLFAVDRVLAPLPQRVVALHFEFDPRRGSPMDLVGSVGHA